MAEPGNLDQQHFASDQSSERVTLRDDLEITRTDDLRGCYVMIGDPIAGTFYRLGDTEFAFVTRFRHGKTVAQAYAAYAAEHQIAGLDETEATELCRWLIENELASTESSRSPERRLADSRKRLRRKRIQRFNPLSVRLPLMYPDRQIGWLSQRVDWFFNAPVTAMSVALMFVAAGFVIANRSVMWDCTEFVFSANFLTLTLAISIGLKTIHETAHAVVCKRYGGHVGEMGVLFILLAPLAYVDVTSVWNFRSRWQRIHVAVAGIYSEWVIASIAALVWAAADDPTIRYVAFSVMLSASISTLVFNANPLMRFDGYFVLTDALRTPNLYSDSQNHLKRLLHRWTLGGSVGRPQWTNAYMRFVVGYGVAALVWKVIICAGLILAASSLFAGLGIVLSVAAVVAWCVLPTIGGLRVVARSSRKSQRRFATISGSAIMIVAMLFFVVPWPFSESTVGVIDYSRPQIVRCGASGFVNQVWVQSGQTVSASQRLVQLSNPDLDLKRDNLTSEIEKSKVRIRQQTQSGKLSQAQAESSNLAALKTKLQDIERQISALTLRADRAGVVVARSLDHLVGTYLEKGDPVMTIGDEADKEIRLMIEHSRYQTFRRHVGSAVQIRPRGAAQLQGSLDSIIPRARRHQLPLALLAPNGGPLPVKADENPAQTDNETARKSTFELLTPHFEAVVSLTPHQAVSLRSGHLVHASVGRSGETVGMRIWTAIRQRIQGSDEGSPNG